MKSIYQLRRLLFRNIITGLYRIFLITFTDIQLTHDKRQIRENTLVFVVAFAHSEEAVPKIPRAQQSPIESPETKRPGKLMDDLMALSDKNNLSETKGH